MQREDRIEMPGREPTMRPKHHLPSSMETTPSSQPNSNKDFSSVLADLEALLQSYFVDKAPVLPDGVKEFFVKVAPYLAIVGVVFGGLSILTLLGFGSLGAFSYWSLGIYNFAFFVSVVGTVIVVVLEAMAIQGLFHRKRAAWNLLFYAVLVQAIENLLTFNVIGLVIGTLIFLYILFQMRSRYA